MLSFFFVKFRWYKIQKSYLSYNLSIKFFPRPKIGNSPRQVAARTNEGKEREMNFNRERQIAHEMDKNEKQRIQDIVDHKFGIETVKDGPDRLGFICNFKTGTMLDEDNNEHSVL